MQGAGTGLGGLDPRTRESWDQVVLAGNEVRQRSEKRFGKTSGGILFRGWIRGAKDKKE